MKKKEEKGGIRRFRFVILIALVYIGLLIWMPATGQASVKVLGEYIKEMAIIMPPVFVLMGLLEVWIPKDKIQQWLGVGSGLRGAAFALAMGTLPAGPLYVAFPMAASLLRKGASVRNMVLFLGAWAALKLPQLIVEFQFLGVKFALLRYAFTLAALALMGYAMEKILKKSPDRAWLAAAGDDPEPSA